MKIWKKQKFYKNIICKAKEADPNSWYRLLNEDLQIEEIFHLSDKEQVEKIAQAFNAQSQTYKPLDKSDINLPNFLPDEVPNYSLWEIKYFITRIKTNKSTIHGDSPAKILKRFADIFCIPLSDIINTSILTCSWPIRYQKELLTPVD